VRTIIAVLLLLLAVTFLAGGQPPWALAADDQATLRIFADTHAMKIAGMPPMPEIPEMPNMPNLPFKIPGLGGMPGMGGAMRMLSVRLFAPLIAPDKATASLAIPGGLKLGQKLDLALYRPQPEKPEEGEVNPDQVPDFTILRYWGSSPTVKPGQPETFSWADITPEQKATLREEMKKAAKKAGYFYRDDWTTGYWPNGKATGIIDKQASLVGHYALTTTFTGNSQLEVPAGVDFLDGINLTSPDLTTFPPLDQAMTFQWDPVPGVLAYHAMIMGMKGEKTMINWSSSEVKEETMGNWDFLSADRIAELVEATVLMAPDCQEVTVPAGIFQDCDFVSLTMIGFGQGVQADGQPQPSLQIRTTLMVTLGGKQMEEEMQKEGAEPGGY